MKHRIVVIVMLLCVALAGFVYVTNRSPKQPLADIKQPTQTTQQPVVFDNKRYSNTDPESIWFIANKHFSLPLSYEPNDLTVLDVPLRLAKTEMQMKIRSIAATDLTQLFTDAKAAGLLLEFGSGYRSAQYQKTLYDGYVSSMGIAEADRSSARPGHSEHQTGLALDFTRTDGKCHLEECFGTTEEGKWLVENAYKYGFILRYPKDKETVTGYMYEPWHFRYVGLDLAKEMHDKKIETLEEFFGTGAAPDYLP